MGTLTIGRLADEVGVSIDTVRFYERRGLLPEPERTPSGYRSYADEDTWRLRFILRAKELGFTLREVADLLDHVAAGNGDAAAAVRAASAAKIEALAAQQAELADTSERLRRLVAICDEGDDEECAALRAERRA